MIDRVECASIGRQLLDSMLASGEITPREDSVCLGQFWLDEAEYGRIHTMIEDGGGRSVVDHQSGQTLAKDIRANTGKQMQIASRNLDVQRTTDRSIEVAQRGGSAANASWSYVARSQQVPDSPAESVRNCLGFAPGEWPAIEHGGRWLIIHFGGSIRECVLRLARSSAGGQATITSWYVTVSRNAGHSRVDSSCLSTIDAK